MDERRDSDPKVEQIRKAATNLFLQRGFGRVSTDDLAKEAGVSKETLYSRYPNKDAVLADVLQHLISTARHHHEPAPQLRTRADLKNALLQFTRSLASQLMQRDYIELARVVIAETPRLPHIGEIFWGSVPDRALGRAAALLESARDARLIGETDVDAAARMLVGPIVIQVLQRGLLTAPRADRSRTPALDTKTHVHLLLAVLAPERQKKK